jgi:thioredoxin reductase
MTEIYDAVIIGGGPAGYTAGHVLCTCRIKDDGNRDAQRWRTDGNDH